MMMGGAGNFGIGFGQFFAMQSQSITPTAPESQPQPVELTAEQLAELIDIFLKLWEESDEQFRKEVGEESWQEFLKYLYEELERLCQSETKQ